MTRNRKTVRVRPGIYQDPSGYRVKVGTTDRRYPPGTDIRTMELFRDEEKLIQKKNQGRVARGMFPADAAAYLNAVALLPTTPDDIARCADLRSRKELRYLIGLWVAEFLNRSTRSITHTDIDTVIQTWTIAGVAPRTIINRRTALQGFYRHLDPDASVNPATRSTRPQVDSETHDTAIDVDYATIRKVIACMPDRGQGLRGQERGTLSKTKARASVIAFVGLPHKLIGQLVPGSIDLDGRTVTVPRRRKGRGVASRVLPLTLDGVAAFRSFIAADAFGPFSPSSMRASWKRACTAAGVDYFVPYALRHSFGTAMYALQKDVKVTGELMMHAAGSKVTHRYVKGAVSAVARAAVDAFDAAFAVQPKRTRKRTAA